MLEFIVLGQVPGTHIQLNLTGVLLVWAGLMVTAKMALSYRHYHKLRERFGQVALYLRVVAGKTR